MINFKTIIRIIGILLLLETVMFLVCSGVSFYYRESDMLDFWKAGGITAGVGLLLAALGKGGERQLTRRDGYVLVSFAWVAFSLFGMLPFYIGGYIPDIANAFFETMSGFSSTGATILDDIESLPHGILFWRSMTQWIGGLGIIMFTIAVLPIFGVSGLQVFAAEASGPTHDKVHPRIGITAKWIWSIYAGITALLVGLFLDLQTKAQNSEISAKALDLRGLLAAIGLMKIGLSPIRAIHMGVGNKSFDLFEREMVEDIIMTRIPSSLEAAEVFED